MLFAPKNPPPFVPYILITSCDATGPCAITCVATTSFFTEPSGFFVSTTCGSTTVAVVYGRKFWITPCDTKNSATTRLTGSSTHRNALVVSTQKFPIVFDSRRDTPRISAMASAMPTAAEAKL